MARWTWTRIIAALMIIDASPASAHLAARVRFALLSLVALLLGHDAVYAARYGVGDAFGAAMTTLGHDGYWAPFSLAALTGALVLVVASIATIGRLQRRLAGSRSAGRAAPSRSAYRHELLTLWPRLFASVVLLFVVQENLEAWLTAGQVPGIDVLLETGMPLGLAVLGLVTFASAAVGALVRWRIAVLAQRLSEVARSGRLVPTSDEPAREWSDIHALAPHRWIADRRDAGRAPPLGLPA